MFLKEILLAVIGISFGLFTAGGVFTVLIAVGLVPRFAGRFHVGRKILVFEEAVIFGTLTGGILSVSDYSRGIGSYVLQHQLFGQVMTPVIWNVAGQIILGGMGIFSGIFVGSLAMAIAEMLDTIPIFSRRICFRRGLGIAILAMALGKAAGSLLYFIQGVYLYGGQ